MHIKQIGSMAPTYVEDVADFHLVLDGAEVTTVSGAKRFIREIKNESEAAPANVLMVGRVGEQSVKLYRDGMPETVKLGYLD